MSSNETIAEDATLERFGELAFTFGRGTQSHLAPREEAPAPSSNAPTLTHNHRHQQFPSRPSEMETQFFALQRNMLLPKLLRGETQQDTAQ